MGHSPIPRQMLGMLLLGSSLLDLVHTAQNSQMHPGEGQSTSLITSAAVEGSDLSTKQMSPSWAVGQVIFLCPRTVGVCAC
jgi:hypothetical protein